MPDWDVDGNTTKEGYRARIEEQAAEIERLRAELGEAAALTREMLHVGGDVNVLEDKWLDEMMAWRERATKAEARIAEQAEEIERLRECMDSIAKDAATYEAALREIVAEDRRLVLAGVDYDASWEDGTYATIARTALGEK